MSACAVAVCVYRAVTLEGLTAATRLASTYSVEQQPPLGNTYAYLPTEFLLRVLIYLYMRRGFASFALMKLARTTPRSALIRPSYYDYMIAFPDKRK